MQEAPWITKFHGTVGLVGPETIAEVNNAPEVNNLFAISDQQLKRSRVRYNLQKKPQPVYTAEALAACLALKTRGFSINRRFLLVDDDKWRNLWLKKDFHIRGVSPLFIQFDPMARYVILPFLFYGQTKKIEATSAQLDKLSLWSLPYLEQPVPVADIRRHYERLIDFIDKDIMEKSAYADMWKTARNPDQT